MRKSAGRGPLLPSPRRSHVNYALPFAALFEYTAGSVFKDVPLLLSQWKPYFLFPLLSSPPVFEVRLPAPRPRSVPARVARAALPYIKSPFDSPLFCVVRCASQGTRPRVDWSFPYLPRCVATVPQDNYADVGEEDKENRPPQVRGASRVKRARPCPVWGRIPTGRSFAFVLHATACRVVSTVSAI